MREGKEGEGGRLFSIDCLTNQRPASLGRFWKSPGGGTQGSITLPQTL